MKQVIPAFTAMLISTAMLGLGLPVSAADKSKASTGNGQRGHTDDSGVQIIIRSDDEKKHRHRTDKDSQDNDNSNRQSDANSSRGLERAAQRRSDQAGTSAQVRSQADDRDERSWYDPFGIFGEDKNKGRNGQNADKQDEADRWWWPFD